MTFWQENYAFIKDVYDMRHNKMAEWMENVEKAISRIMADKVYTSAEFKRERDNFHVSIYVPYLGQYIFIYSCRPSARTWRGPRSRSGSTRSWRSSWQKGPNHRWRRRTTSWLS